MLDANQAVIVGDVSITSLINSKLQRAAKADIYITLLTKLASLGHTT